MKTNLGEPCKVCKVGFYLELKQQKPAIVNCYNCKHTLPYLKK